MDAYWVLVVVMFIVGICIGRHMEHRRAPISQANNLISVASIEEAETYLIELARLAAVQETQDAKVKVIHLNMLNMQLNMLNMQLAERKLKEGYFVKD